MKFVGVRLPRTTFLVASSSANVAALQLAPLLLLSAIDFGFYSIIQLIVVLGSSASLALINEADVRRKNTGFDISSWRDFSAISFWLSVSFSLLILCVTFFVEPLREASFLWALGTGFAVYRGTVRYRLTQENSIGRLILGDLFSIFGILMVLFFAITPHFGAWGLPEILVLWLTSQFIGVLFTVLPKSINPFRALRWIVARKRQIAALAPDSALQDFGAFWGPNLIAVILDVQSLGIYRAVTTVAAPIRLVLSPLRPIFAKQADGEEIGWRNFGKIFSIASFAGVVTFAALQLLRIEGSSFGALGELSVFAPAVAIYVIGNFLSYLYSIQARAILPSWWLIRTRIIQATMLGFLPVLAAIFAGLEGAIWALAIGSLGIGVIWFITLMQHSKI